MTFDVLFFWIVILVMFMIGLPTIRRTVTMPAELTFEEIPRSRLTPALTEHYRALDPVLAGLGFSPLISFRVTNLGSENTLRLYLHQGNTTFCFATCLSQDGPDGRVGQNYLEFIDEFQDGTSLTTRNASIGSVFAPDPRKRVFSYPDVDAPTLYQRHRERLAEEPRESRCWPDAQALLKRGQEGHREMCDFQAKAGYLEFDPPTGRFRATYRLGLSGIGQFLNPFADHFTWARFLPVLVLAVAIPLLGLTRTQVLLERMGPLEAGQLAAVEVAWKALLYGLSGAAVGWFFPGKTFIWSFLVSYLPQAVTGSMGDGHLVWCFWAGFVAEVVSRSRLSAQDLHRSPAGD